MNIKRMIALCAMTTIVACVVHAAPTEDACEGIAGTQMDGDRSLDDAIAYAKIERDRREMQAFRAVTILANDKTMRESSPSEVASMEERMGEKWEPLSEDLRANLQEAAEYSMAAHLRAADCLKWLERYLPCQCDPVTLD